MIESVINIISRTFYVNTKLNLKASAIEQGYLLIVHSIQIDAIDIFEAIF